MATTSLLNEKLLTTARVCIEGDELQFVSLSLQQNFFEHHYFEVVLDYDLLQQGFMNNPLEQIKLIGKFLDIELMQSNAPAMAYEFRGIIQNVFHKGEEGKHGYLVIKGASPTILLERGKRLDVFCNMTLQQVFNEATDGIANKMDRLPCHNKPVYSGQLDFLMQYNESDWTFLRRLSAISGETLFYTGRDLVFGEYEDKEPFEVTYDKEITSFEFGARLLANNFTRYQYLPDKDETLTEDAPGNIENSNEYLDAVDSRSKEIELAEKRLVKTPVALPVKDTGSLHKLVEREKTAKAAQTVYIKGVSKTCDPRIGRLLKIHMPASISGASDLGTFRITSVTHTIDQEHHYSCEFEGIPGSLQTVPTPEATIPTADSMIATVIANNDPQGQGRIKVEFPFANDRTSDAWLRMMTPDAGSGDEKGSKNRGMVFIPEKGSEVMVGFEAGDPNRPYVLGGLFTGGSGGGGGADNNTKSLTTRSGHTIMMNDGGGIDLIDKTKNNKIGIDGNDTINVIADDHVLITNNKCIIEMQGDKIRIYAPEEISLEAKNIGILASDKLELRSKEGNTKEIIVNAQESMTISSKDKMNISSTTLMEVGSTTINMAGKTEVNIGGEEVNINS